MNKIHTTRGIYNDKWDRRFLELAKHIAQWSKDPSTKVGAVLVDDQRRVVSVGYNGFPMGCLDDEELYANRELKYKRVVHAEVNAIISSEGRARGCKLYVYPSFALPNICCDCAKTAIQAGIAEVIGYEPSNSPAEVERRTRRRSDGSNWEESIKIASDMLNEAGVYWRHAGPEPSLASASTNWGSPDCSDHFARHSGEHERRF